MTRAQALAIARPHSGPQRCQPDVALGNVIGSSIYTVFGILGLTAVVHPIMIPPEIARLDIWVRVAATALLILFLRPG